LDKNTVIGFTLIFFLMIGWFYFTMPSEEELAQQRRDQAIQDSLAQIEQTYREEAAPAEEMVEETEAIGHSLTDRDTERPSFSGVFGENQDSVKTEFTVETPLYTAVFTNKGAGPSKFILKTHDTWAGQPVQMIADTTESAYNLGFLTSENYNVETQNLLFKQVSLGNIMRVGEGANEQLVYELPLSNGQKIQYTYTFYGDKYEIDLQVRFIGISNMIVNRNVDFGWTSPLKFTEKDHVQEAQATSAYLFSGGELEQLKVTDFEENNGSADFNVNGQVRWVATKTKFFSQLIKPVEPTEGAGLSGRITGDVKEQQTRHLYSSLITSDIPDNNELNYELYIGPMKYSDIKQYDEHAFDMVEVGYAWLRWFSNPFIRFIVIPFFTFFSGFISNYGILIIIFAATVKLILSPLTFKSYKSMAAMRELSPQMKEIQEKYADNPQKQQQATMDLYRKNKVNPLGGCLPMLLQFPILVTLWRFFQNSILLRQESFLWANDLSAPDFIIHLPFSIPIIGSDIAGFVIFMAASMALQSKLTGGASSGGANNAMAQQMKIMQYFLPIMMLFIFNNFASGLSLYYLVFNILSIAQQMYINRNTHKAALETTK